MKYQGTITLNERDYEVSCWLKIVRNGDGDSDVPYGSRSWLEVEKIENLQVEDESGNEPSEAMIEAIEEAIVKKFDDGEIGQDEPDEG